MKTSETVCEVIRNVHLYSGFLEEGGLQAFPRVRTRKRVLRRSMFLAQGSAWLLETHPHVVVVAAVWSRNVTVQHTCFDASDQLGQDKSINPS